MLYRLVSVYLIVALSSFPLHAGVFRDFYQRLFNNLNSNEDSGYQPINDGSPAVGAVTVQFSVNQMGSTQLNIPIAVAPGTAGMAPQLSINYDSQGPNSTAGMGAGLQGLTSIVRCNADKAHNDRIHGVDFSNDDLYCLNGQQLVALNGAYGVDGTEYRTYQDSFTKVVSHGQQGNGPAWFTVYSKNGQIATYGNTQDSPQSQLLAQGKNTVAGWSVSKIIDRTGNYMTVSYMQDQSTSYPTRVDYTGNDAAGLKPYNAVTFDYENRDDIQDLYRAGSHMIVAKRLAKVTSYNGSDVLFTYQLSYDMSPTTNRSRLVSVTECAGDGTCLKPVNFKWSDPQGGEEEMSLISDEIGAPKNDMLVAMVGSLGDTTSISYKPLTDPSVYTKGTGAVYPVQDIQAPMFVVAQTSSDDGVGGQHVTNYFYTAARLELTGFGYLGFETVTQSDLTTGISATTTYSQDVANHLQQLPLSQVTSLSNGTVISKTSNVWVTQTAGNGQKNGTVYASFLANATKQSFELDGSLTSTIASAYTYDLFGNATQVVETAADTTGNYVTTTSSKYINDTANWLLGQIDPATMQTTRGSDSSVTRKSSFGYDAAGFLMSELVEPDDDNYKVFTAYNRDSFGNVISTTVSGKDIVTRTSKVQFDARGQFPLVSVNALGQSTSATYDARFGTPATETDLNGHVTKHVYDGFGREVLTTRPDGMLTSTSFAWCDSSCPVGAVYSNTEQTTKTAPVTVYVDILGRTIAKKTLGLNGEPIWEKTVYDNLGRVIQASAPYFEADSQQLTVSQYDVLGRVTKTSYPNGGISQYRYQGLTVSMTDALGHTSSKTANVRGWMTKTVDAAGSVTTYQYDTRGNLTVVTDSQGHQIINTYDLKGRKIKMQDPDLGTWTYTYNVLDQMVNQTDANGNTTTFAYDLLSRVVSRTDPAGTSTWEYDTAANGIGKLAKVQGVSGLSSDKQPKLFINDAESMLRGLTRRLTNIMGQRRSHLTLGLAIYSESLVYDSLSRLQVQTVQIDGQSFSTKTAYGDCSRVTQVSYPSGVVEYRQYNDLGYLNEIDDVSGKLLWRAVAMDARGHITQELLGNGVKTIRSFDNQTGLLTGIQSQVGSGLSNMSDSQGVLALGYTYDLVGNLLSRSDGAQQLSESFQYQDNLNRLTKYVSNNNTVTYQYDELGNIVSKSDVGTYTYGENGAGPHAVTSIQGLVPNHYTYDKNGNQTKSDTRTVTYTSFGKPLHIATANASVDFLYDANRDRFMRTDTRDSGTKTTLYLGAYERISSATDVEHRHMLGGVAVYTITTDTQGNLKQTKTSYLHMGSLGSIEAISDELGQVIQRFRYDPFGVQTKVQGSLDSDAITYAGFTGQEEIVEMGLIHMNGRMYDPLIGRFVTADPFIQVLSNSQSLNRYSYVMNNPMTNTDPSGYFSFRHLFHKIGHAIGHALHDIGHALGAVLRNKLVDLVANVVIGALTMGAGWVVSALAEAAFSAAVTEANGGSLKDVLKTAAISFATSALDKWSTNEEHFLDKIGMKQGIGAKAEAFLGKTVLHGVTGGAMNILQGKSFKNGFVSGATAEALSMVKIDIKPDTWAHIAERSAAIALVGGTKAALTGGNFVSGAESAGFNELSHDAQDMFKERYEPKDTTFKGWMHWAQERPLEGAGLAVVGAVYGWRNRDKLESMALSKATNYVWSTENDWLKKYVANEQMGNNEGVFFKSLIHGVTGGSLNALQGKSFEDGFFSKALSNNGVIKAAGFQFSM